MCRPGEGAGGKGLGGGAGLDRAAQVVCTSVPSCIVRFYVHSLCVSGQGVHLVRLRVRCIGVSYCESPPFLHIFPAQNDVVKKSPKTGEPAFGLQVFAPREDEQGQRHLGNRQEMAAALKDADPRLRRLAEHAEHITCTPMLEIPALEEWVHPDGRVLCLGEAAHPTPVRWPLSAGWHA